MSGTDEETAATDGTSFQMVLADDDRTIHNNSSPNSNDQEDDDDEPPLPRHHSYLPGELQPVTDADDDKNLFVQLMTEEENDSFPKTHRKETTAATMILEEFPILELPNVILFPGATLPIRLTERLWVEYISREIRNRNTTTSSSSASRSCSKGDGSTTTTSIRLGVLCLDPHSNIHASSSSSQQGEHSRPRRRRRFWFRRTFGPTRLQRLSMQLLQELGGDAFRELENEDDDEENNNNNETTTLAPTNVIDPQQQQQQQYRTATIRHSQDNASSSSSSSSSSLSATEQAIAQRNRQRQMRRRNRRQQHQQQQHNSTYSRYVGRVGTIATVLFVHGPENLQERIITTYGSGRFQILAKASSSSISEMGIPRFRVREIPDDIWKIPSAPHYYHNNAHCRDHVSTESFAHASFVRYLSQVSSIPHSVVYSFWPWRLMSEIRTILTTTPWLQALDEALPPDDNHTPDTKTNHHVDALILHDPVRFSFWIAQNLPIPQSEKLALFETIGIVERLQWILEILSEEASEEAVMHCRNCLAPIARARDLFTVGGAEGTSGNYVNEYGCVHQTITLRSMDENEVWYQGRPEIRDSWFPGYSWTIMNCSVCGHHLGWKFRRLLGRNTSTSQSLHRPNQFFGVSAANVTTFVPSQHSFEEQEQED